MQLNAFVEAVEAYNSTYLSMLLLVIHMMYVQKTDGQLLCIVVNMLLTMTLHYNVKTWI